MKHLRLGQNKAKALAIADISKAGRNYVHLESKIKHRGELINYSITNDYKLKIY